MTECIKFPVSFAGHHFEFIAFLVDIIDDFDFVIGSKSMFELEADMKYSNLTFEFAKRSIKLIPTRSYCYIVGLGLNCKFIDLLFKRSFIKFIEISSHLDFIVSEIIYSQTDTLT